MSKPRRVPGLSTHATGWTPRPERSSAWPRARTRRPLPPCTRERAFRPAERQRPGVLRAQALGVDHDPSPAQHGTTEHVWLLAQSAGHRRDVVVGVDAAAAGRFRGGPLLIVPVEAGPCEAEARTGLTLRVETVQRRPERLGHRRLQAATRPGIVGVHPPEAVADGGDHAGVVIGTSSSLSVRCGSLSGASSGSDTGSGISITLTGLLVNPMVEPWFHSSKRRGLRGDSYCQWSAPSGDFRTKVHASVASPRRGPGWLPP